jgi:hypothetical protein
MQRNCSSNVILNFDTGLVIGGMDATSLEKGQAESMRDDPWSRIQQQPIDFHLQTVLTGSFWSSAASVAGCGPSKTERNKVLVGHRVDTAM